MLCDEAGEILQKWNIDAVPNIFVLDTKGVIRYRFVGNPGQQLDEAIRILLAEATGEEVQELAGGGSALSRFFTALGNSGQQP